MPDPTPTFGPNVSGQSSEQDQAQTRARNIGLLAAGLGLLSARTGGNVWRAIGEGGLTGLEAYSQTLEGEQKARDDKIKQQYEQQRIDVSERRADIEQQRANAYQEHQLRVEEGGGKLTEAETYAKNIKADYAAKGMTITDAQAMHLAYLDKPQITTVEMAKRTRLTDTLRTRYATMLEGYKRSDLLQKEEAERQAQHDAEIARQQGKLNEFLAQPAPLKDGRLAPKTITYNADGTFKIGLNIPPTRTEQMLSKWFAMHPDAGPESPDLRMPGEPSDGLPAFPSVEVSPFGRGMPADGAGGFNLDPAQADQIKADLVKSGKFTPEQADQFLASGGARGYSPETHDTGTLPHSTPEVAPGPTADILARWHITPNASPAAGIPAIWNGRHYVGTINGAPTYWDGKDVFVPKKYAHLIGPAETAAPKKAADTPPVGAVLVKDRTYKGKPVYRTKDGKLWSP